MWYIYVSMALLAAALIAYIILYNRDKQNGYKRFESKWLDKINEKYGHLEGAVANKEKELEDKREELHEIEEKIQFDEKYAAGIREAREKELAHSIEEQRTILVAKVDDEVKDWAKSAQEAANASFTLMTKDYDDQIIIKQEQLKYLICQIAEYKAKQDAMNEEILRRRALEEKQEFYRIQLTDAVKDDIAILNEIRPRLSSVEIFNKFIYDNYLSRPTKEMVQRVLSGRNPSGIYKVTNIQTEETYIGKSVKVADRWQNHCKAAAGLGGVAESQFQRALKKYGLDSFTWELLEEVDKDKLTEREKYYINFYDTKTFGYNQREG